MVPVLVLLMLGAGPWTSPGGEILDPGPWPARQVDVRPGEHFLALCGDRLVPVIATRQGVQPSCAASFLVRRVPRLRAGAVTPAQVGRLGTTVAIRLGHERASVYRVLRAGHGSATVAAWPDGPQAILHTSSQDQNGHTEVIWAGDIDGDGSIDIVVAVPGPGGMRILKLFLSGPARTVGVVEAAYTRLEPPAPLLN